ncbi:MAG: FAD-dependent oxidoreductase [Deltaproteobacteria bacterium]|nr:FAD-dependent oxidoreductase [Deltaproteobacteria bacterium]
MIDTLPKWAEVDVLVLGGGPAGFSAALASARSGAQTMLVEQHGFLGGMATAALVMPWNVWARPITSKDIGGAYAMLIEELKKNNGTFLFSDRTVLRSFDPSLVKIIMDDILLSSGVQLLFHTLAVDVVRKNDEITGVVLQSKAGRGLVTAKSIVDATGDGDIAVRAGAGYEVGKGNQKTQPGTLIFKMGGVDIQALIKYLKNNRSEVGNWPPTDEIRFGDGEHICVYGLFKIVEKAKKDGLPVAGNSLIMTSTPVKGLITINITKVFGIDMDDPMSLSRAEINARKQVVVAKEFMKHYVPGFEDSYLADIGIQIGIRETRRIRGDCVVTMDDILAGRHYDNRVARLFNVGHLDFTGTDKEGKPVARFEYLQKDLEIPAGSLTVNGIKNLTIAGRCISTDPGVFGFIRTQTACFATGQASGTIAAFSALEDIDVQGVDIKNVQAQLLKEGIEL